MYDQIKFPQCLENGTQKRSMFNFFNKEKNV